MSCNATFRVEGAYFVPGTSFLSAPNYVRVCICSNSPDTWEQKIILPLDQLSVAALKKTCPFLRSTGKNAAVDDELMQQLQTGLQTGRIEKGYYFQETGAIEFPDGCVRFLRGSELLPDDCSRPYICAPEIRNLHLAGSGNLSATELATTLLAAPPQVLLTLAYVSLTSVCSLVHGHGIDLQAVLYIVGGQGLGKTTLATRVAGIYQNEEGRPSGLVQAGSTAAAVESLLVAHRDQPVIVDDLCLSAGRETARKRRELGAKLVREGSGDVPIIKRSGSEIKELRCNAGVILTAEFPLDNMSDLTRCIIVPVNEKLKLPSALTPVLVGDTIRCFSTWFSANKDAELQRLETSLGKKKLKGEPRIQTNYACLRWAFQGLISSLTDDELTPDIKKQLKARMKQAIDMALDKQMELKEQLKEHIPQGNLAYCILEGYQSGAFKLTKKVEKLGTHDGIKWKGDLCLRPEALICFVRKQPGYHDWTRNKITRYLLDLCALVIQEDESYTVHLQKPKDGEHIPRVYRIRLDVLKKNAKSY